MGIICLLKTYLDSTIQSDNNVCDDNDPPWFNKRIKFLIQEGTLLVETFRNNRNNVEKITCPNNLNDRLTSLINTEKENCKF